MSTLLDSSPPGLSHSQPLPPIPSSSQSQPQPPIQTFHTQNLISSNHTDLVIQTFDDRILVILTQNGKIGSLTQATLPEPIQLLPPPPPPTSSPDSLALALPPAPAALHLLPLLGSPPEDQKAIYDTYISQIATLILWALQLGGEARRGVVVGLALSRSNTSGTTGTGTGTVGSGVNGKQEEAEGEGENEGEDERERERFREVMKMVASWPGPSSQ